MDNTPNYGLKKPAQSDDYNVQDQNDNMDVIDGALKELADKPVTGSTIYMYKNVGGAF